MGCVVLKMLMAPPIAQPLIQSNQRTSQHLTSPAGICSLYFHLRNERTRQRPISASAPFLLITSNSVLARRPTIRAPTPGLYSPGRNFSRSFSFYQWQMFARFATIRIEKVTRIATRGHRRTSDPIVRQRTGDLCCRKTGSQCSPLCARPQ